MYKILLFLLFLSTASHAELYELKYPSKSKFLKNIWVPVLNINGWHQDKEHTLWLHSNIHVPDGSTYINSPIKIFANAVNKKRHPKFKSLTDFIDNYYIAGFGELERNVKPKKEKNIYTADGKELISYSISSLTDLPWERVSYGEEGDYFTIFTLSGRTEDAYKSALPIYLKSLEEYSATP